MATYDHRLTFSVPHPKPGQQRGESAPQTCVVSGVPGAPAASSIEVLVWSRAAATPGELGLYFQSTSLLNCVEIQFQLTTARDRRQTKCGPADFLKGYGWQRINVSGLPDPLTVQVDFTIVFPMAQAEVEQACLSVPHLGRLHQSVGSLSGAAVSNRFTYLETARSPRELLLLLRLMSPLQRKQHTQTIWDHVELYGDSTLDDQALLPDLSLERLQACARLKLTCCLRHIVNSTRDLGSYQPSVEDVCLLIRNGLTSLPFFKKLLGRVRVDQRIMLTVCELNMPTTWQQHLLSVGYHFDQESIFHCLKNNNVKALASLISSPKDFIFQLRGHSDRMMLA